MHRHKSPGPRVNAQGHRPKGAGLRAQAQVLKPNGTGPRDQARIKAPCPTEDGHPGITVVRASSPARCRQKSSTKALATTVLPQNTKILKVVEQRPVGMSGFDRKK